MRPVSTTTHTIETSGCTLTYDVHGDLGTGVPLFAFGSPMTADGFTQLTAHFGDRAVVTYDPRGAGRSPRTDGAATTELAEHATDLARIIDELGVDAVDVFGTSGGAVNSLVLAQMHPTKVRTLVAHEPPLPDVLPDRAEVLAAIARMDAGYDEHGFGAGMAAFIQIATYTGEFPTDFAASLTLDPAMFGMPSVDDGRRDDPLLQLNRPCLRYVPDIAALASAPLRLVVAYGVESAAVLTGRSAIALATRLDREPTTFPSHHTGFVTMDWLPGDPEGFAARLHEVLDA